MTKMLFLCLVLSCFSILSGCTSSKTPPKEILTPFPQETINKTPNNDVLMSAVKDYISLKSGPAHTQYEFTRVDLNNDGRQDALVLLKTPFSHWCTLTGCRMIVLEARNGAFSLLSEVEMVRGPLVVSHNSHKGWRDLVLRFDGIGQRAQHVALTHNGNSYPSNPLSRSTHRSDIRPPKGHIVFP